MKKILIILLALFTFGCVLAGLFFYEKSLSNNIFRYQGGETKYAEEKFIEEEFFSQGGDDVLSQTQQQEVKNTSLEKNDVFLDVSEPKEKENNQDLVEASQIEEQNDSISDTKEPITERKKGLLYDDDSIQKFVSPDVSFYELSYVPKTLIGIQSPHIFDIKGNAQLRPVAVSAFYRLAEEFYGEFEVKIPVVSTYRSYNYQKGIKERGCPDSLCAKAGYSEHQTGLAIDVWETTTNELFLSNEKYKTYFEWLQDNAHRFGYHNSYQKGVEIDGYEKEPWHWRYLGMELAGILKEQDLTFTQYYQLRNSNVVK